VLAHEECLLILSLDSARVGLAVSLALSGRFWQALRYDLCSNLIDRMNAARVGLANPLHVLDSPVPVPAGISICSWDWIWSYI